ncbi:MAG: sigma 54-interacting transcriptional regulator, partial [Bilophila wadsworthia]
LIESELFGYVGGAFTGARKGGMIGKMELAKGGTLFLDEVNSLPLEMQAKLLRALQQMEIVRIGDTKPTPVDVRI